MEENARGENSLPRASLLSRAPLKPCALFHSAQASLRRSGNNKIPDGLGFSRHENQALDVVLTKAFLMLLNLI